MSVLTPEQVLALVPQRRPFRFVDRILELDDEHIVGRYAWTEEDCRGAAPPGVVPGSSLLEMSAQVGNVAWCIFHMARSLSPEELGLLVGVLTEVRTWTLLRPVRAGETVACLAEFGAEGYFRSGKLVAEVRGQVLGGPRDGAEVFTGILAGMWVPRAPTQEALSL